MDPIGNVRETFEQLKVEGGFALTHVVELRRTTGEVFDAASAEEILQALYYFLSFVRGAPCAPVLPTGFGPQGDVKWNGWRSPIIDPYRAVTTWVDPNHPESIAATFPGFFERWRQPGCRETLQISIGSYVKANEPTPVELAVATAQIVLELLAATILVEERGLLSKAAFDKLTAAETIQMALRVMEVPTVIPERLVHLRRYASGQSGPAVTARLRNGVIHSAGHRHIDGAVWTDAWRLSTWYVEMALLWACGFSGVYGNRQIEGRSVGAVDRVPWAQ